MFSKEYLHHNLHSVSSPRWSAPEPCLTKAPNRDSSTGINHCAPLLPQALPTGASVGPIIPNSENCLSRQFGCIIRRKCSN
jgi:hypothetical protein